MTGSDARDKDEQHHDAGDLHENPGRTPAALAPGAQTGQSERKDRAQHSSGQAGQRPRPNIDGLVGKQVQKRAREHGQSPGRNDDGRDERRKDQLGAGGGQIFALVKDKYSEDDERGRRIERHP